MNSNQTPSIWNTTHSSSDSPCEAPEALSGFALHDVDSFRSPYPALTIFHCLLPDNCYRTHYQTKNRNYSKNFLYINKLKIAWTRKGRTSRQEYFDCQTWDLIDRLAAASLASIEFASEPDRPMAMYNSVFRFRFLAPFALLLLVPLSPLAMCIHFILLPL